jgi:hypothetical protein
MKLISIKSNDVPLQVQCLYALLFIGSVFCGLWLHGEPDLMFGVMIATPFMFLLSRIPMSVFPPFMRQLAQIAVGAMAFVWVKIRMMEIPWDILIFEGMSILALALFIGRRPREYGFLLFCCCCMLGYGGLLPGRRGFFPVFFLSLLLVVVIMYLTRTSLLVGMKLRERGVTLPLTHGSWTLRFLHFATAFVLMIVLIYVLPFKKGLRGRGLIPVSFDNDQELLMERYWERWGNTRPRPDQDGKSETDQNETPNDDVDFSENSNNTANMNDAPSFDSQNGDGASPIIGTDLVFRAYAPSKLYWVVQMYDTYDGSKWTQSEMMKSGNCLADRIRARFGTLFPQRIILEKSIGPLLPYAYRFEHGRVRDPGGDTPQPSLLNLHDNVKLGIRSLEKPELPLSYFVMSYVPNPKAEHTLDRFFMNKWNFGQNYRALPQGVISKRTYDLAHQITEGAATPYEKACRIRDHLRTSYTYDLHCPPVPPDGEVVDFFLFESKKGYCQHFAQAFAVLARAAGLHSRLVTGYSPGNFNLLSNCFEIYEYHAHAWVQIFINSYGWLTFDGVAPGNLHIENTPKALNSLLDPFGDEWESKPPEFSIIPPRRWNSPENLNHRMGHNRSGDGSSKKKPSFRERIFRRAARDNRVMEPDIIEMAQAAVKETLATVYDSLTGNTKSFTEWLKETATNISNWFRSISLVAKAVVFAILAVLIMMFALRKKIMKVISFHWTLHKLIRQWKWQTRHGASSRQTVMACQRLTSGMLDLARFNRPPSEDLLERAEHLKDLAPGVAAEYHVVAMAAADANFAPGFPNRATASKTLAATQRFLRIIKPYLKRK